MKPGELQRLIQDHLDGVATTDESARLGALLERSPDARIVYGRMERVFRTLEQVELVEPPPDLAAPALGAIEARGPRRERARWRRGGEARIGLARLAFAFIAGTGVGMVGFLAVTTLRPAQIAGNPPLTGTVLPSWGGPGPIERKRLEFEAGGVVLESRKVAGGIAVSIQPARVPVSRVVLDYDPRAMRWVGLRQEPGRPGRSGGVAWSPGRVVLEPKEPGRYVLEYAAGEGAGPIGITVTAGDQALRAWLKTSRGKPALPGGG